MNFYNRKSGAYAPLLLFLFYLGYDIGVFDFCIFCKQKNFGHDFCCFWVVVHKGQKDASSVLGMDGYNKEHGVSNLMDDTPSKMDGILAQFSVNDGMISFNTDVFELEELYITFCNCFSHFYCGMASLWVYAARIGNADCQIYVPHNFTVYDVWDFFDF